MQLLAPSTSNNGENSNPDLPNPEIPKTHQNPHDPEPIFEEIDSTCSTPYVSAPSSPGRTPISGFFYSAPASPMHFAVTKSFKSSTQSSFSDQNHSLSFEFEFSARFGPNGSCSSGSMTSADELFLNGQIRPMKLSTHLEHPLPPLPDLEVEDDEYEGGFVRGRDLRMRDKSLRRRTRSMSPLRNDRTDWTENEDFGESKEKNGLGLEENERKSKIEEEDGTFSSETTTRSVSASSSRSSSAGRSSKRWVFLKDFLYRSKSEGRSNNINNFWSNISFSPGKEKKSGNKSVEKQKFMNFSLMGSSGSSEGEKVKAKDQVSGGKKNLKAMNGVGKRRVPPSAHEIHYTVNRAQSEEMRKKTFLPYRQGLLGCLGFSSKGYGAVNGFARALNPVSSR